MDKLSLVLKYIAGFFLLVVLAFFAYAGKISADVLVAAVTAALGAIGVHAVRRPAAPSVKVDDNGQGGFVRLPLLFFGALVACALIFAGCATTTTTTGDTTVTTPDLTSVCKNTQSALTVISAVATAYDTTAATTISNASAVVADLCTAGATVDAKSVATLASTTIPDLIVLVKGLDIDSATKATALAALAISQVAINTIVTQLEASSATSVAAKAALRPVALKIRAAQAAH